MNKWMAGLAGVAVLWAGSPAAAKVVTLTYTGTVTQGADGLSAFGGGLDLTGQAFTAAFTFDTDNAARTHDLSGDRIDGGWSRGLPSFLSASLTIGGLSATFAGGSAEAVVLGGGIVAAMASDTDTIGPPPDLLSPAANVVNLAVFGHTRSPDLDVPGAWRAADSTGYFQLSRTQGGQTVRSWGLLQAAAADTGGNAVPEPAVWSLMILGFGAAGAMLRRKRLHA